MSRRAVVVAAVVLLISIGASLPSRAAEKTKERVYGEPRSDSALIYFIRAGNLSGAARSAWLFADETFLCVLDNNTYTFVHAEPGAHALWSNWTRAHAQVEWLPGRTYYYQFKFDRFEPLSPENGRRLVDKAKSYAVPTPEEVEKSAEYLVERFGKAMERLAESHFDIPAVPTPPRPAETRGLVRLPAETPVRLVLAQTVSSFRDEPGSSVHFRIAENVVTEGVVVFRKGAPVRGVVRRAQRAKGSGVGGILDLVVPGVPSDGGPVVPVVGQIAGGGAERTGKVAGVSAGTMIAAGPVVGLLVGGLVKGDEAFELAGGTTTVWTRDEVWVPPAGEGSPHSVPPGASCSEARNEVRIRFRPHLRKDLHEVEFEFGEPPPNGAIEIVAADGEAIPEPVRSSEIRSAAGTWNAVFDGWQAVRFLVAREAETTVRLEMREPDEGGRCFEGTLVLRLDDRRDD